MDATDRLFGETAVKLGHLSREQLAECIRTQYDSPAGTSLGQIALDLGFMQPSDVEAVLAQQTRNARKGKPRGIVEIDATQGGIVEERVRSDARSASAPPHAARSQTRNARTQPNQPPIAAAYRAPSAARIPAVSSGTLSDSPPQSPKPVTQRASPALENTRPSRRADRTLIGTAPSGESAPAHEAITVIPPPDEDPGPQDFGGNNDPEVSFETLASVKPRAPSFGALAAPSITTAVTAPPPPSLRQQSTPPDAPLASVRDSETDFGSLLSQPPPPPPTLTVGGGTIHGVGAPNLPQLPAADVPPSRARAGTIAFSAPLASQPVAPVTAPKPNPDKATSRSGTMQHFRAVTPAQPEDLAASRAPSSVSDARTSTSLTPSPSAMRQTARTPRRASAWFSSLPALPAQGAIHGDLPARVSLLARDSKDPALAQLPAGPEPTLHRAVRAAIQLGAYDVHLHRGSPVLMRLHGSLQPLSGGAALGELAVERSLAQVMSDGQWRRLNERGEVMFSLDVADLGRLRVSAFRAELGCSATLRVFPAQARNLAELGLPATLAKLLDFESGLIVCTGPVGSGVTTTLAAMAGCVVQSRQGHVVTLEEVIELRLPSTRCLVSQRQLGTHVNDMARAVRAVAHEDADLVVAGELRNAEDIALTLSLAHGGHLVLAGAHARNATDCVNRLTRPFGKQDQAQARAMLAQSLRAVISQQLVRRADGAGRVPAIELIVATPTVCELIRDGAVIDIARLTASGKAQKLITLQDSLQRLVASGTIDADEAERVIANSAQPL